MIAHCQLVGDDDLGRFAALGVIPNMQPLWAQLDALMMVLSIPRLGSERADKQYSIKTLDTSGAPLGFGSDWPVSAGAPLDGIAIAVSRSTPDGEPAGGWTPHEILPVERALSAYTAGVAKQAFAENNWVPCRQASAPTWCGWTRTHAPRRHWICPTSPSAPPTCAAYPSSPRDFAPQPCPVQDTGRERGCAHAVGVRGRW